MTDLSFNNFVISLVIAELIAVQHEDSKWLAVWPVGYSLLEKAALVL